MEKTANNKIGGFFMKRKAFIIILIIILIIFFFPQESKEFRIRVVAASDSVADQSEKHAVVRVIKEELKKYNQDDIINEINKNIDLLEAKIAKVLRERKFQISITKQNYPTKEWEGKVISGGRYKTLLVVIEKGEGKNWWSILYPAYHNISFEDGGADIEFEFYFFEKFRKIFSK
jgi:stage II sporulation protein R